MNERKIIMTNDLTLSVETANAIEKFADISTEDLVKRAKAALNVGEADIKKGKTAVKNGETQIKHGDGHLLSAGLCLIEVKRRVQEDGTQTWPEWLALNWDVKARRADELIQIADGRITAIELRSNGAARVAKHRAANKAVSVTESNVTLTEVKTFDIDKAEAEIEAEVQEVAVIPAPVDDDEVAARIAAVSLDPPDFDQRLTDAYAKGYADGFAAGVVSVSIPEPSMVAESPSETEAADVEAVHELAYEDVAGLPLEPKKPSHHAFKYRELTPQFFNGTPEGQLRSIFKLREEKPAKVIEYRRAILSGKCKTPPIWLLSYKFREKLAALDIPEPAKKVPQHDSHVKAHAFMQKGFALIEAGGANIADLTF